MTSQGQTLKQLLAALTKDELHQIRKNLRIKGASQLNKSELAACLARDIPFYVNVALHRFDVRRLEVLQKVLDSPVGVAVEELVIFDDINIGYFMAYGLLLPDAAREDRMCVPWEVRQELTDKRLREYSDVIRRNTQWTKLAKGLLYYYGYASFDLLERKIEEYTKREVSSVDVMDILLDYSHFDEGIIPFGRGFTYYMADQEEVVMEHAARSELEYAHLPRKKVMQAAEEEDGYVERNESYLKLVSFLTSHYDIQREMADLIVEESVMAIVMGNSPNEVLADLLGQFDAPSMEIMKQLTDLFFTLYHATPQWALKGHSPNQMSNMREEQKIAPLRAENKIGNVYSMQTKQKIGRNDPCPCGSGKKYKKCCGG
ncbi:SEC-C metal-binding domain-containing protein [Paenibacillus sp. J5C_2022]|uniref:YecA family protein n=1 Tax=Paenibacillus sp. J5C2022 TaxID=2977129 RepID=UPI0021CE6FEB|nr:SEC-C metal-binding domain-containing protein [Paenibacillus sp. J5C2022]MCU6709101.1 SEC-C metal-binding domain-containing protein [Paenibacillus sp. J5C2022]